MKLWREYNLFCKLFCKKLWCWRSRMALYILVTPRLLGWLLHASSRGWRCGWGVGWSVFTFELYWRTTIVYSICPFWENIPTPSLQINFWKNVCVTLYRTVSKGLESLKTLFLEVHSSRCAFTMVGPDGAWDQPGPLTFPMNRGVQTWPFLTVTISAWQLRMTYHNRFIGFREPWKIQNLMHRWGEPFDSTNSPWHFSVNLVSEDSKLETQKEDERTTWNDETLFRYVFATWRTISSLQHDQMSSRAWQARGSHCAFATEGPRWNWNPWEFMRI